MLDVHLDVVLTNFNRITKCSCDTKKIVIAVKEELSLPKEKMMDRFTEFRSGSLDNIVGTQ